MKQEITITFDERGCDMVDDLMERVGTTNFARLMEFAFSFLDYNLQKNPEVAHELRELMQNRK